MEEPQTAVSPLLGLISVAYYSIEIPIVVIVQRKYCSSNLQVLACAHLRMWQLVLGNIDYSVYHDTLVQYHDIPDVLVEFNLYGVKETL